MGKHSAAVFPLAVAAVGSARSRGVCCSLRREKDCESAITVCVIALLVEGCDMHKSLLLHYRIYPDIRHLCVVITFISGVIALLCGGRCEQFSKRLTVIQRLENIWSHCLLR